MSLVLLALWTISEGQRRGLRLPWIFMERQSRYNRYADRSPDPAASSTV